MAPLTYTDRDFASIRARLRADAAADPILADVDLSDGARETRLLTALARETAGLSHLLNNYMNEGFLVRAVSRAAVIDHTRGIGYELGGPTPSRTPVRLYVTRTYSAPVTIPAGTELQTDDGTVPFETDADVVLPAFALAVTVGATQGRTSRESTTGALPADTIDGQRFALADAGFVVDSESVTVSGITWTRVANFLASDGSSRHYVVERDAAERATIVFGDGTNGYRPPEGAPISVRYRTCIGQRGRVGRQRVTRVVGSFQATDGQYVDVRVVNPAASIGGTDAESIRHARIAAPASVRTANVCVSREDFEYHAGRVAGVARVLCLTRAEDPTIPALVHRLYVVPEGGGVASADLLAAVITQVTVTVPTFDVAVVEAYPVAYTTINVVAELELRENFDEATVLTAAGAALTDLFSPTARVVLDDGTDGDYRIAFGQTVPISQIEGAIQAIPGVYRVRIVSPTSDATLARSGFPQLAGTPTLTVVT